MEIIKNNRKIVIVLGVLILLLVTNTIINSVISSKIDEEISDFFKEIGNENFLKYEDITYSFLSSKITFEDIEINEDEREYLQIEKLEITFDKDELPSINEIKEGDFKIFFSDAEIDATNIKFVNRDDLIEIINFNSTFNGEINPDEEEFHFKYLDLELNGLEMDMDDVKMELGNLEFQLDVDELINIANLNDEIEKLPELDNLSIKFNLDDYTIPRQLTKEMDLDDIGIRDIEGKKLSIEISKDDDDMNLDFELNTQNLGQLTLEAEIDFSKNKKDPVLELEISLDDLNEDFSKILKRTKFEERGENSFRFQYEGNLKDIQKAIM